MQRKAAKGLWAGGARPLGYLIDRDLDKLVPDPVEMAIVRRVFDLYTKDRLGTQATPQCGRRYVGTAAHGRYKTYRYYTCWSRARYGTTAGCDIHRFDADEIEAAIGTALLDFYTASNGEVIATAVADFQAQHAAASHDAQAQLTAVTRELREATAAIDRYLTAFEKGTLDDEDPNVQRGSPT